MRISRIFKLVLLLLAIYVCITLLSLVLQYIVFKWSYNEEINSVVKNKYINREDHVGLVRQKPQTKHVPIKVEVWGKAAISLYFWHHIFGEYFTSENGAVKEGGVTLGDVNLKFRYGGGLHPATLKTSSENIVLIANSRKRSKIEVASTWIRRLAAISELKNAFIILLGNEKCHNKWLFDLLEVLGQPFRSKIKTIYVVYDAVEIDNKQTMQWPLGVATYRGFPVYSMNEVDIDTKRQYTCNFLGTVYNGSSRSVMYNTLLKHGLLDRCYFKGRNEWIEKETSDSLSLYQEILVKSDLTLCPVGHNTECYRIYEALSLGSLPVVEDAHASDECASTSNHPLQLLKKYNAPFIYVSNWDNIHKIIKGEDRLSHDEKVKRRIDILSWYAKFKLLIRDNFLNDLKQKISP